MSWYEEKTKGDFAESICANHFKAIGYEVEYTGIENTLNSFIRLRKQQTQTDNLSEKVYNRFRYTPDLLISRINTLSKSHQAYSKAKENSLQSWFIEVKYRTGGNNFSLDELEYELFWQYRHMIWNCNIIENFTTDTQKTSWNTLSNKLTNEEKSLIDIAKKTKVKYQNLPIIFYLVLRNKISMGDGYIYLNLPVFAGWKNIKADNMFKGNTNIFSMYASTINNTSSFSDTYDTELEPILTDFLS